MHATLLDGPAVASWLCIPWLALAARSCSGLAICGERFVFWPMLTLRVQSRAQHGGPLSLHTVRCMMPLSCTALQGVDGEAVRWFSFTELDRHV